MSKPCSTFGDQEVIVAVLAVEMWTLDVGTSGPLPERDNLAGVPSRPSDFVELDVVSLDGTFGDYAGPNGDDHPPIVIPEDVRIDGSANVGDQDRVGPGSLVVRIGTNKDPQLNSGPTTERVEPSRDEVVLAIVLTQGRRQNPRLEVATHVGCERARYLLLSVENVTGETPVDEILAGVDGRSRELEEGRGRAERGPVELLDEDAGRVRMPPG